MGVSECAVSTDTGVLLSKPVVPTTAPNVWLSGGTAVLDIEGRLLSANDTLTLWLGGTPDGLLGQSLPVLLGQRCPDWKAALQNSFDKPEAFHRLELSTRTEKGEQKIAVELHRHEQFRFVRLESALPSMRDLEEAFPEEYWGRATTHAIFNRLIRAEAQLDNLVHRWPGIIFSQRPDFSFSFVSPGIEELTGVAPQEWRRQTKFFWQVIHESDVDALMEELRRLDPPPEGLTTSYRIRHIETGRVTYLWEHRQPVRSSNGLLLGYEGIWLDITRQTIAERRLLNMSWKENLGTLTMGLAHDFCNIMTGIVALSETFEQEFGDNETLRNGLSLIRSTAGQASELAHRIRQLHQGKPGEKNYHDLNQLTSELALVLQKVLSRRIRLQTELAPTQAPVYVDAVELRQVIVNLALNAADAMPNGGSLSFRTALFERAPSTPPVQGKYPRAPLVCLSVQDTGAGISPCYLQSIFDPFFTTKPLGKGSGLGLYNVRLFAESHDAAVSIETQEQNGTTFHIWFAQADFSETHQVEEAASPTRHTFLVVGPPGEVRERMVELLRSNGFYVVPAKPNYEALEALHSTDYSLSGVLLLCPPAHSEQTLLLERIRSEKLALKIFLTATGCNQDDLEAGIVEQTDAMLPQDMSAQEMVSTIRKVLART